MSTAHSQRASGEAHLGYVVFITAAAALGGFLFGYDSSVINGAVSGIQGKFAVGSGETGLSSPRRCWARRSARPSPAGSRTAYGRTRS
ncbi:hypothetical protein KAURM247S_00004 [Kitasatospora aureofaciens]